MPLYRAPFAEHELAAIELERAPTREQVADLVAELRDLYGQVDRLNDECDRLEAESKRAEKAADDARAEAAQLRGQIDVWADVFKAWSKKR